MTNPCHKMHFGFGDRLNFKGKFVMAGKGNPPGSNNGGGMRKGYKTRKVMERELRAAQKALAEEVERNGVKKAAELNGKMPKDILFELSNYFYSLAAQFQPIPTNTNADPKQFQTYMKMAADYAARVAPYYHQKLATLTVVPMPMDLTRLSNEELMQLEALHAKASLPGGDTGGAIKTIEPDRAFAA